MTTTLVATPSGNGFFIAGTFTSTQVLNLYPPAANGGCSINTTDLGLLTSDGVRWLVQGTPPIPAGAAILGYKRNLFTVLPVLADITMTRTNAISRLYNGAITSGSIPPSSAYTTASNGQLQLIFPGGGPQSQAGYLATINSLTSQQTAGNLGYLPMLLAGQGFYVEEAVTMGGNCNNTDSFNAFYLLPQEHNTIQLDNKPGDPTSPSIYEKWMEFDVNENGHGTDLSGQFRGAALSTQGFFSYPLVFTAPPSGTSGTISTPWPGDTLTTSWPITFSDGQKHNATMTNGSTAVSWSSAITGSPTVNATVTYGRNLSAGNVQMAALDYTVEHIFGLGYDPVGQTVTFWMDGTQQATVSTAVADTISNSWHYYLIFQMGTHGSNLATTMNIRYFSAWTP